MYYIAFALDYDGTIAHGGRVDDATLRALRRAKETGRKLILVTGRLLPDLEAAFPALDVFNCVVAENGGLLYTPANRRKRLLAPEAEEAFVARLKQAKVEPLSVGDCIVSTWHPNESVVLETIRDLGLELQITFNKGAVMVLPSGVNKESGLAAACKELEISPLNVIGVGDAENDEAFLRSCGFAVAVANALPAVKKHADHVTEAPGGAGVAELVERIISSGEVLPSQVLARPSSGRGP
jgi:phosphoglycolate phosphatase (TIGR01487 family)